MSQLRIASTNPGTFHAAGISTSDDMVEAYDRYCADFKRMFAVMDGSHGMATFEEFKRAFKGE